MKTHTTLGIFLFIALMGVAAAYPSITVSTVQTTTPSNVLIYNPYTGNTYGMAYGQPIFHEVGYGDSSYRQGFREGYNEGYDDGAHGRTPAWCQYDWFGNCRSYYMNQYGGSYCNFHDCTPYDQGYYNGYYGTNYGYNTYYNTYPQYYGYPNGYPVVQYSNSNTMYNGYTY